jgi:hypothetical protein
MAKIDPSKLTVDFKSLMRLSMSDRYAMAQSSQGQSYLASLTPTQFAMLFPDYYRQRLPDMGISGRRGASAPSGAGSRPSGGTPSSGASTYTPPTAAPSTTSPTPKAQPQQGTEVKPSWQKRIEEILKRDSPGFQIKEDTVTKSSRIDQRGYVNKEDLYKQAVSTFRSSPLNGFVPKDGDRYGIRKGTPEEWANLAMRTVEVESSFRVTTTNPKDEGGSFGLFQWGYHYGINKDNWKDPQAQLDAFVKYSNQWVINGGGYILPPADVKGVRRYDGHGGFGAAFSTFRDDKVNSKAAWTTSKSIETSLASRQQSALEKSSTATPGDPSKTGTTEQTSLRPKTITADPRQLEQLNRERKHFYSGKLTMEGVEYTFGSGGRKAGSMPYGTFDITGLHRKSQYKFFENNSFYVKDMFDPKVGRNRVGMLIHSQTDLDKLYSAGCIAISRKEWPKFKAHLLDYMKRSGSMSITVNPDGTAYIGPKGSEPTTSVADVTKDFPKLPQGVDPKEAMELEKRMPKDLNPQIVKYMKENMSIEDRRSLLDKLEKKPELLTELNGLAAKTIETKNSEPAKKQAAKILTDVVNEDTMPESLLDLRVKTFDRGDVTLRELGVTKFSELTKKGGQAFAGGANDRTTTLLAGDIQQHFGENFGRITAQNDLWHKSNRAPGTSHRTGRKLDFTLNDADYRGGHKRLSKYLAEKYGMEEGKDFKIISRPHGDGPHMDFELTPSGGRKVSAVLEPRTEKETEVSREAALPAQEKPNKIFVAGLEDRGENFKEQSARMGAGTKSFRHNSDVNDIIKYAKENPDAPITLFSAGNKHLKRLLDAGIDARRITMSEPYKPDPDTVRDFTAKGGNYIYGDSFSTGKFRGVDELPNARARPGKTHFDSIVPSAIPVQEKSPLETASTQPQAEGANKIKKVLDAGKGYTKVEYEDGRVELRKGQFGWRNNNPGNIIAGKFAESQGAIPGGGRFALFPTLEAGNKARRNLLFESDSYKDLTVSEAIRKWAPPSENNSDDYARRFAAAAGVPLNTKMKDFTEKQRNLAMKSQETIEGNAPGTIEVIREGVSPAPVQEEQKINPIPGTAIVEKEDEVPAKYAGGEVQTRGDTATVINDKGEPLARINPDKEQISLTGTGNIDVQPTYRTDPRALEQQNAQRQEVGNINIDDRMQEMSTNIMNQVRQMIPQGGNPNWESMMTSMAAARTLSESPSYTFSNESFRRAMAGARFEKSGDSALGGHFEVANSNLT